MNIKLLDIDTMKKELRPDDLAWIVYNKESQNSIAVNMTGTDKHIHLLFLKEGDAGQYSRILNQFGPEGRTLGIKRVPIGFMIQEANKVGDKIGIVSPNDALDFFKQIPESLPEYYARQEALSAAGAAKTWWLYHSRDGFTWNRVGGPFNDERAADLAKKQRAAADESAEEGVVWNFVILDLDPDVKPYFMIEGTEQQIIDGTALYIS